MHTNSGANFHHMVNVSVDVVVVVVFNKDNEHRVPNMRPAH